MNSQECVYIATWMTSNQMYNYWIYRVFCESSGAAKVVYEVLVPLVYLSHHFQVANYIAADLFLS